MNWISVKERLPKTEEDVWGIDKHLIAYVCFYDRSNKTWLAGLYGEIVITYWAGIELPKGKE